MHGIIGKEFAVLLCQLSGQGLVVSDNEGRFAVIGDDIGGGECLSRAGHAEQGLTVKALLQPLRKRQNRLWLVAGWFVGCCDSEEWFGHILLFSSTNDYNAFFIVMLISKNYESKNPPKWRGNLQVSKLTNVFDLIWEKSASALASLSELRYPCL